jgi:hypothetical protein
LSLVSPKNSFRGDNIGHTDLSLRGSAKIRLKKR